MTSGAVVRFSPIHFSSDPTAEGPGGGGEADPGGPVLASHDVVLRGDTSLGREPMGNFCSPGPSESGARGPVPSFSPFCLTCLQKFSL